MSSHRSKPGITSHDFKYRPTLFRQRQSSNEMGTASRAGGLFRQSFAALLERAKDPTTHSRFAARMLEVLKTDTINPVGERRVENGNLNLLEGIEFNSRASLHLVLGAEKEAIINRIKGELSFSLKSFIPKQNIKAPAGASHFKIVMAGIEADFATDSMNSQLIESGYLALDDVVTGDLRFTSTVTPNSLLPLFLVAGLQFYDHLNGAFYPLLDKKYLPLRIVQIDTK